jgi:flavin reductase (DIM6/NTAB) family NADH-FMN oxidoreductase RutF
VDATGAGALTDNAMTTAFESLTSGLEYPMFVVTAAADGERNGCLAGFVTQCSIDPPVILVCVSKSNRTFRTAQRATTLAVHYLGVDDERLASLFGERTGDEIDKFAQCSWTERPDGTPVLDGCRGWVAGDIMSRADVGDHVAMAVRITAAEVRDAEAGQLGFQRVKDFDPGHPA